MAETPFRGVLPFCWGEFFSSCMAGLGKGDFTLRLRLGRGRSHSSWHLPGHHAFIRDLPIVCWAEPMGLPLTGHQGCFWAFRRHSLGHLNEKGACLEQGKGRPVTYIVRGE